MLPEEKPCQEKKRCQRRIGEKGCQGTGTIFPIFRGHPSGFRASRDVAPASPTALQQPLRLSLEVWAGEPQRGDLTKPTLKAWVNGTKPDARALKGRNDPFQPHTDRSSQAIPCASSDCGRGCRPNLGIAPPPWRLRFRLEAGVTAQIWTLPGRGKHVSRPFRAGGENWGVI